jgi:hypothetical protein
MAWSIPDQSLMCSPLIWKALRNAISFAALQAGPMR